MNFLKDSPVDVHILLLEGHSKPCHSHLCGASISPVKKMRFLHSLSVCICVPYSQDGGGLLAEEMSSLSANDCHQFPSGPYGLSLILDRKSYIRPRFGLKNRAVASVKLT